MDLVLQGYPYSYIQSSKNLYKLLDLRSLVIALSYTSIVMIIILEIVQGMRRARVNLCVLACVSVGVRTSV